MSPVLDILKHRACQNAAALVYQEMCGLRGKPGNEGPTNNGLNVPIGDIAMAPSAMVEFQTVMSSARARPRGRRPATGPGPGRARQPAPSRGGRRERCAK